jgi:hypothetical protein
VRFAESFQSQRSQRKIARSSLRKQHSYDKGIP